MSVQRSVGPWRLGIVEDHLLQRMRTEELLSSAEDLEVVFSGETTPEFMAWLRAADSWTRPHLLILDLMVDRQPSVSVKLVRALLESGLKIVVLSALASPSLVRSIVQVGVSGFVGKRDSEQNIIAAVRAVLRGEEWMTTELAGIIAGDPNRPRLSIQEERVLILYASGLTLDEVASAMNIKRDTAKQYLNRVKAKYTAAGVVAKSKLDLSRIAVSDGLLDPELPTVRPSRPS